MAKKILVDTSCIYAALNRTIDPPLSDQIPTQKDSEYWTGQYLRMEFLRRYVVTGIEVYCDARIRGSLANAIQIASHGFSSRRPRILLQWLATYVAQILANPPDEPIEQFGILVLQSAIRYDTLFNKYIPPKTRCKRGEIQLDLSLRGTHDILNDFYDRFTEDDVGCNIAPLKQNSKYKRIKSAPIPSVSYPAKKAFQSIQSNQIPAFEASCTSKTGCPKLACQKAGDVFISIEQAPTWTLYHTDHSFDALCEVLKHRNHKCVHSTKKTTTKTNTAVKPKPKASNKTTPSKTTKP